MSEKRASKVVKLSPMRERKVLLDCARRMKSEIEARIAAEDAEAGRPTRRSRKLREGAENDLGVARAGKKLDALGGTVDGFGRWIDRGMLHRLGIAIRRLEAGQALPRQRFYDYLKEEAGLRPRAAGSWGES